VPAAEAAVAALAPNYRNDVLGNIAVAREGKAVYFKISNIRNAVASRKNDDGTISFITITPTMQDLNSSWDFAITVSRSSSVMHSTNTCFVKFRNMAKGLWRPCPCTRSPGGQCIKISRCSFFEQIDPPAGGEYILIA